MADDEWSSRILGIGDGAQQANPVTGDANKNAQNGAQESQKSLSPTDLNDSEPGAGDTPPGADYAGNGFTWNFGGLRISLADMDDPELTLEQKRTIADTYTKASLFGPKGIVMQFVSNGDPEKAFAGLATDLLLFLPNLAGRLLHEHAQFTENTLNVRKNQIEKQKQQRNENMALIAEARGFKKKDITSHIHADMIAADGDIEKMAGNFKKKLGSDKFKEQWEQSIAMWDTLDPKVAETLRHIQNTTPDQDGRIALDADQQDALLRYSLQKNAQNVYGLDVRQSELNAYVEQAKLFQDIGLYPELHRQEQLEKLNARHNPEIAKKPHITELERRQSLLSEMAESKYGTSADQVKFYIFQDFIDIDKKPEKLRENLGKTDGPFFTRKNDTGEEEQIHLKSVFENLAQLRKEDVTNEISPQDKTYKENIKADLRKQVEGTPWEKVIDTMITQAEEIPMKKDEDGQAISPYSSPEMDGILQKLYLAQRHQECYGVQPEPIDIELHERNLNTADFKLIKQTNWHELLIDPKNPNPQQGNGNTGFDFNAWWEANKNGITDDLAGKVAGKVNNQTQANTTIQELQALREKIEKLQEELKAATNQQQQQPPAPTQAQAPQPPQQPQPPAQPAPVSSPTGGVPLPQNPSIGSMGSQGAEAYTAQKLADAAATLLNFPEIRNNMQEFNKSIVVIQQNESEVTINAVQLKNLRTIPLNNIQQRVHDSHSL